MFDSPENCDGCGKALFFTNTTADLNGAVFYCLECMEAKVKSGSVKTVNPEAEWSKAWPAPSAAMRDIKKDEVVTIGDTGKWIIGGPVIPSII